MNVFMTGRILSYIVQFIRKPAPWVIIGLSAWLWVQSLQIERFKVENQAKLLTIADLTKAKQQLSAQLAAEQQAVEKQRQITHELKTKSEKSREKVRIILQKEPCANTPMPSDVTDSIKRLHNKGKD